MYKWNAVYNKVIEIKRKYQERFGAVSYDADEDGNCLGRWIKELGMEEYIKLFQYVQINQKDKMLLLRYKNYADVFGGEENITADIFWNMHGGFYQECRSLVIDVELEIILLSPFKKFKNLHEGEENQLEKILERISKAKTIEITNKLDGSMQSARYVPEYGKVIMSGSQAIDAGLSWRLADGLKRLTENENYLRMLTDNPHYTFIFEYITLQDAHVVAYKKEQEGLYLIGLRNVHDGKQENYSEMKILADKYGARSTEVFDKTFDDVLRDVKISAARGDIFCKSLV